MTLSSQIQKIPLLFGGELRLHLQPELNAPTALLLGWYGASFRNLNKYAEIYRNLGYHTAMTVAPHVVVFSMGMRHCRPYIHQILAHLRGRHVGNGGLVVHGWSNGGALLMNKIGEMIEREQEDGFWVRERLSAVIFDSAPCYLLPSAAVKAITMRAGKWELFAWFIVYPLFMLSLLYQFLIWGDVSKQYWDEMASWKWGGCKEVYMWSRKDTLLDDRKLNELLDLRVQKGANVVRWRVNDAEHVLLLRSHRAKYVEIIRTHVHLQSIIPLREKIGLGN